MAVSTKLKIGLGVVGGLAFLAGAAAVVAGNYLIHYALVTDKGGQTRRFKNMDGEDASVAFGTRDTESQAIINRNRIALMAKRDAWLAKVKVERVSIRSADDRFDLAGFVYPTPRLSRKWVVLIHGYTGNHTDMEMIASFYADRGFNVLAPDLRSHGESEGDFIGMGWTDRLDILAWMDYLLQRYGSGIKLVLHGHSMGAACALMVTGEKVPPQLVAAVADCAYTDVWTIFADQMHKLWGLYPPPLLEDTNLMLRIRGGYDLKDASAIDQVRKSTTPTLFIQGAEDDMVPHEMVYELFEACGAREKKMLVINGAGHAQSNQLNPELYFKTVFDFLNQKLDEGQR